MGKGGDKITKQRRINSLSLCKEEQTFISCSLFSKNSKKSQNSKGENSRQFTYILGSAVLTPIWRIVLDKQDWVLSVSKHQWYISSNFNFHFNEVYCSSDFIV